VSASNLGTKNYRKPKILERDLYCRRKPNSHWGRIHMSVSVFVHDED